MLDASRRRSGSVHHPFSEPSSDEEPLDAVKHGDETVSEVERAVFLFG